MTTTFRMKHIVARKLLCHIENYCYSLDDVYVFLCVFARAQTHIQKDRQTDTETYVDSSRQFAFRKHFFNFLDHSIFL
jgi:hypothetical protein